MLKIQHWLRITSNNNAFSYKVTQISACNKANMYINIVFLLKCKSMTDNAFCEDTAYFQISLIVYTIVEAQF